MLKRVGVLCTGLLFFGTAGFPEEPAYLVSTYEHCLTLASRIFLS